MKKELFLHIKHARRALVLTVVFGVLAAIVTIAQMVFLSKIVDRVFLAHENLAQVELFLLLLLGAIIVRAGLVWVREVTAQQAAMRVKSELRERLFAHLLQLGPAYSKGEHTGELVATVSEGIERLDAYVSRYLPQMALSVLVPLLIAAFILPLDWTSAVLLVVTGPIIPLLMILVGSYAEQHIQRQWVALSRMSAHFLDVVQGLPTLLLFGRSGAEREQVAKVSERFCERTMSALRIAFLSGAVLEFLTAIAIGLVAVVLGVRLLNGGISFEQAFLVLLLAPEFYRPLRELGVHRHAGMEGNAAAKRIIEILETPVPVHAGVTSPGHPIVHRIVAGADLGVSLTPTRGITTFPGGPTATCSDPPCGGQANGQDADYFPSCTSPSNGQLTIEFTDVTYTYPGNDHPALKEVNLTLPVRTCTALLGRSGAGKSTVVNLLLRFMDVQGGRITVNGIPLSELPVEVWREYVALVPQRPYLFSGSVRANIRLARPGASNEEVMRAAELAGAEEFIKRLSQNYDTEIGERGARLSAGQVQRIAIARAFLKDAPLLVLDEPTSSLDPESEVLIRQALEGLVRDRTVLVIAHRYNTIAHAEQVAVLEDGCLVEVGQRAVLGQRTGPFSRFIDACRKV